MEEKDSERMDWILIEHQEKGVEQDRRGQRKKRMRESSGRKGPQNSINKACTYIEKKESKSAPEVSQQ